MKAILTAFLFLLLTLPCLAEEPGFIKRDVFRDRDNIYSKDGTPQGYIKDDLLFDNRKNIYDWEGNKRGYLRWNEFKEQWDYHEEGE